jgi:hypothetical protein
MSHPNPHTHLFQMECFQTADAEQAQVRYQPACGRRTNWLDLGDWRRRAWSGTANWSTTTWLNAAGKLGETELHTLTHTTKATSDGTLSNSPNARCAAPCSRYDCRLNQTSETGIKRPPRPLSSAHTARGSKPGPVRAGNGSPRCGRGSLGKTKRFGAIKNYQLRNTKPGTKRLL